MLSCSRQIWCNGSTTLVSSLIWFGRCARLARLSVLDCCRCGPSDGGSANRKRGALHSVEERPKGWSSSLAILAGMARLRLGSGTCRMGCRRINSQKGERKGATVATMAPQSMGKSKIIRLREEADAAYVKCV
jgi:hypothetical protein